MQSDPEPMVLTEAQGPLTPVVANLPHCGTWLPAAAREALRPGLRSLPDTDWHVDRLFDFLPALGVTTLKAQWSRYLIDLNRELREPLYGPIADSAVAADSFDGRPLYLSVPGAPSMEERVERYYRPYHGALRALLDARVERFGRAFLIDLHSFDGVPPADIVLGDDEGRLDSRRLMAALEAHLDGPFRVLKNEIWTGGHITVHYGALEGVEAVQIETDHGLYLDEEEVARSKGAGLGRVSPPRFQGERFEHARARLAAAFRGIVEELAA